MTTENKLQAAIELVEAHLTNAKTAKGAELDAIGEAVRVYRLRPPPHTAWIDNPEIDVSYRERILARMYQRLGVSR